MALPFQVNPIGVFANLNKMAIFEYRFITAELEQSPRCFFLAAAKSSELKPEAKTECRCSFFLISCLNLHFYRLE